MFKAPLAATLAGIILVSTPATSQVGATSTSVPSISVGARGEVKVTPDRATVQFSVQTRAATAAQAATENARKQRAVIDALRGMGIAANDISTINYNVYPDQRYEPNRAPVVVGYNVTNTVSVEVKNLSQVGQVIDVALSKGANMVSALQFFASNTDAARRDAIALAIQRARAEAEAAARAAGGSLGGLLEISIGAYFPPPPRPMELRVRGATAGQDIATPINPGEQTLSVELSTRWAFVSR